MKIYIKAATKSQGEIIHDLQEKIWDYIDDVLFEQNRYGYFKQVRRTLSANGRKYTMKNYAKYNTMVITNPEGEEIFRSSFPDGASRNDAKSIAIKVVNDAYGDETDLSNKRVELKVRANYTSYGSNSGGPVVFGEYVDKLRKYYVTDGDPNARYFAVMIKASWSGHDQEVIFSDNKNQLVGMAQDFIHKGSMTPPDKSSEDFGRTDYRFYADVVDSQTGEEIYADMADTYNNLEE